MKKIEVLVLIICIFVTSICYAKLYDPNKEITFEGNLKYNDLLYPVFDNKGRQKQTKQGGELLYHYHKYINEILKGSEIRIGINDNDYLIQGYSDGSFRPDNSVTKAEFVKMAVSLANTRSFDYTLIPNDKYNGHWATPYLYVAEMQEIIEPGEINNIPGYANIDDPITRMEVIRILSRIQINMKSVPKKESMMVNYLDVDPNDYSQEDRSYILHAANYNLIDGMVPVDDSPLYLRPTDPITRAEAVRAILRVY